jgi:hypothetical protein
MSAARAQVNSFFTPTQISGCQLWLDAADPNSLVISGSNVSQWRDKSGMGYSLTQATLANQPTRASQLSGIRFEGQRYLSQRSSNVATIRDLTTMTIYSHISST